MVRVYISSHATNPAEIFKGYHWGLSNGGHVRQLIDIV